MPFTNIIFCLGCPNTGFYYGIDCCSNVNCQYCRMDTGTCLECKPGYIGDKCDIGDV